MSDTVETILVRRKQTGDECLINATDFDPEQHEKASVEQNETPTSSESSEPASNASSDNGTNETRRRGGRP